MRARCVARRPRAAPPGGAPRARAGLVVEAAALLLAAGLTIALVLFVARPFLRDPVSRADRSDEDDPAAAERLSLLEERDRALAALKELEFDHRTGKVSDTDYRELLRPLRREAAEALRALETKEAGQRERVRTNVRS